MYFSSAVHFLDLRPINQLISSLCLTKTSFPSGDLLTTTEKSLYQENIKAIDRSTSTIVVYQIRIK